MKKYYANMQELLADAGWIWDEPNQHFCRSGQIIPFNKISGKTADLLKEILAKEDLQPLPVEEQKPAGVVEIDWGNWAI